MSWWSDIARLYVPRKGPGHALVLGELESPSPQEIDVIETSEEFTRSVLPALLDALPDELALEAFASLTRRFDERGLFIVRAEWQSKREPMLHAYHHQYRVNFTSVDEHQVIGQCFMISDRMREDDPNAVEYIRDRTVRGVGGEVFMHIEGYNDKKRNKSNNE